MAERVLSVRLRAIVDQYNASMASAAAATDKVTSAGAKMEDVGKKMTLGFSAPMIAAGGFALKSAIDFESAFAGVEKTVDGTRAEMAMLSQEIVDMANSMPSTREEIAGVAEAAGQLGIEIPNIMGFTRTMLDLGNSTDIVAHDAAISLAQLAAVTGMSQNDFDRLGSTIVALGNNFETQESKIVMMSQRLAGAGAQIGLSEAEIVGLSTALSSVGIEAEMGGSAMQKIMMEISKAVSLGSSDLAEWARVAGMSADEFSKLWREDAGAGMAAMTDGLGRIAASGEDLFGTLERLGITEVRTAGSLLRIAGAQGKVAAAMDMATDAWDENSALAAEAGMRYATTESQLKTAANRATDVARQFGEVLVPAVLAAVGVVDPLTRGLGEAVQIFAVLPTPIQALGGALVGVAVAAGPAIWAGGKLMSLYAPVVSMFTGIGPRLAAAATGIRAWGSGVGAAASALTAAARSGAGLSAALGGMAAAIGPQVALAAAVVAVGGALYLAKRRADEMAAAYTSGADAAIALADSAGLAAQELGKLNDAGDGGPALNDEEFRKQNEDTIKSLREIGDMEGQLAYLREIGYGMALRGVDPEDVLEQVEKLAETAGIEIPVKFTVGDVTDFDHQIESAVERARRAAELESDRGWGFRNTIGKEARLELENIARMAGDLWDTDQTAEMVQLLAEAEEALGGNARAAEHLGVQMIKAIDPDGTMELSTSKVKDLESALREIASPASTASQAQKDLAQSILDTAAAMDGGITPANLAAAAADEAAGKAGNEVAEARKKAREEAEKTAAATDELTAGMNDAANAGGNLAESLTRMSQNMSLARLDFEAGAAAAQAFAQAIDATTSIDNRMSAGLAAGSAWKALREGMTGEKAMSDVRKRAAKETRDTASAVDRLGDAARRADPKLSAFNLRLESLSAAGKAFRESLDNSTMIDDQITQALSLGDAYRSFEKTYRRLPVALDMTALATGKLRPRTAEAVQNMLNLGRAARDWLGTLIEMGKTDAEVAGTAAQMRHEYTRMFREMGMSEAQIRQYLEAMGLLPEQITTAIKVSGAEAARTRLTAYLQLLEGRIPPEVATSVIAKLEADDIEGAASELAAVARNNPALIEVGVDPASVDNTHSQIDDIRSRLWQLPKDFDPLTAAMGGYSDAQQAALEGVQQLGVSLQGYLQSIIGGNEVGEARRQAYELRDAFLEQMIQFGLTREEAEKYAELVGLTDWQIEAGIKMAGFEEAVFKLQFLHDMLTAEGGAGIPDWLQAKIAVAVTDGDMETAANLLSAYVRDMQDGVLDNPILIALKAEAGQAVGVVEWFRNWFDGLAPPTMSVEADTTSAQNSVGWWKTALAQEGVRIPVHLDVSVQGAQKLLRAGGTGAPYSTEVLEYALGQDLNNNGVIGRASGGPVWPGQAFMVGEDGPELGVFPSNGHIFTAEQTKALLGGGVPTAQLPHHGGGPVTLDDTSIRKLAEHMGGGDRFGDINVYSPSERQTPRRIVEAVGAARRRR